MASSYLKQPLRTLEQALEDRAQIQTPSAVPAHAADPVASGPVELLIKLLSGDGPAGAGPRRMTARYNLSRNV